MWIKINSENDSSEFVKPEKILDYNKIINITKRDVNSARQILTLYGSHQKIICRPHKGDYQEWLNMLRLSREAIATTPEGY